MDSNRDGVGTETPLPASQPPDAPMSDRATNLALALILALVFLAYLKTLWFQFVYDDRFVVLENTWLRSWAYLPRYFTRDVWDFQHPIVHGNAYRPVLLVWFRLQYLIFGLNPRGWHLGVVLCHLGATLLAFYTAERLLEDRLAALFTALLFGLHPTHGEAVAWVSGVGDPLFALFLFASYLFYFKKRTEPAPERTNLAASLGMYALACLSKETAVVLPFIILGSEFVWSEQKVPSRWRRLLRRFRAALSVALPYLGVFAAYLVVRVMVLKGFQNPREEHPLMSMILTWPRVLWFYLQHLVWPARLSPFYYTEYVTHLDIRDFLLPSLPVLMAGAVLWYWGTRSPRAAVATLWMVVPLLPVLDVRSFREGHLVHDRFLYLPSFGFAMLMALGLRRLKLGPGRWVGQQIALAGLIGLIMAWGVARAMACYANVVTFCTYATATAPVGHNSPSDLARMLAEQGALNEAIKIYRQALSTQPDNCELNYGLGLTCYLAGKLPDADQYLGHAVQMDCNLPNAFFYLGLTKLKRGDVNAAATNVQRAITLRPDGDYYHFALGVILKLQGNLPGALAEFHQAMALDPDEPSSRQQAEETESEIRAMQKGSSFPRQ